MGSIVEGDRNCSSCGVSETQAVLFDIIIPSLIPRSYLCEPYLAVAIDNSKKKKEQ